MAIAFLAILALHVLSAFLSERIRRIALPINIALHALLIIPAMFLTDPEGTPIELDVIALFYMLSLAVYTVFYFISDAVARRREKAETDASRRREADDDL